MNNTSPKLGRVLITGGCGFIGSNLARRLIAVDACDHIAVIDNESLGNRTVLDGIDVEFISGDMRNDEDVRGAVKDMDAVVHLAADTRVLDSIDNPVFNYENNVQATFNLLLAMRDLGVERLANASTGGAILGEVPPPVHEEMVPKPLSPYGASKLAVEGYCSAFSASYGLKALSMRFSNVYG
ncbi:MAG TPA: NAD-dependent epimerase/dehydratase family protein, partial [Rhizobiales bacterium]|nr:NAD-dependent epimerase/dehydratase family protein [Hyphomicrobiales bacterium]